MSKRLYVGNLPFSVNSEKLKEIFSAYGAVEEATVVSFKDSGKSKGFGFVTYTNDADGEKAKTEMNGKELEGRKVFVNEAKPFDPNAPRKPRRSFGDRGDRRFGGGGRRRFDRRRDDSDESEEQDDAGDDSEE
jgi:cold-inducible RNA-binding protein